MKRRAFVGTNAGEKYERSGHWLRAAIFGNAESAEWCSRNGIPLRKAQGEGIGQSGGFLVNTELSNAILDLRDVYGAFRRRARIIPMASDNASVPRHTGATANSGAATAATFFGENTAATASNVSIDKVDLSAKKIGALVTLSNELEFDSAIVDFVANEVAWAFGVTEDDCAFNGDGTSTYGGMRGILQTVLDGKHTQAKVTAASAHNTFLTLDATDIANVMSAVRASAVPNAAWFISQTGFAQTFCRLSGTAGGGYMYTAEVDGIMTPFYLGFPVILCQKMPLISTTLTGKGMLAFGDMYAGGILGQRRGVTLARSDHRYMDSDQVGILGTERFDAVIQDIGDNTNPGSIAVLVAP